MFGRKVAKIGDFCQNMLFFRGSEYVLLRPALIISNDILGDASPRIELQVEEVIGSGIANSRLSREIYEKWGFSTFGLLSFGKLSQAFYLMR